MAQNADSGITELRGTVDKMDRFLDSGGEQLQIISADLKASARQLHQAMASAAVLLNNTDQKVDALQRRVLATLNQVDQAGQRLNLLLDRLSQQPSQLIFSGPRPEKTPAP